MVPTAESYASLRAFLQPIHMGERSTMSPILLDGELSWEGGWAGNKYYIGKAGEKLCGVQ